MKKVDLERIKFLLTFLAVDFILIVFFILLSTTTHIPFRDNNNTVIEIPQTIQVESKYEGNSNLYGTTFYTDYEDLGSFKITYYCACEKCCEKNDGITASGNKAIEGRTIAADTRILPMGSVVVIDNHVYVVEDIGGAIKGNKIDIYVESHEKALEKGVKFANVYLEV